MENSYQLSRIHNYINGLMSKEEMFLIEKEALEDPFLQDAIEGYRLQNGVDVSKLSLLQQRLNRRIEDTKLTRNAQFYTWQRLAIGSAAGVIFVVLIALMYFRYFIPKMTSKTTEVELIHPENMIAIEPILSGGDASPVNGWKSFEQYLQKSELAKDFAGTLVVNFEIGKDGHLRNIQFEDNVSVEALEAARKLLSDGPEWQGEKGKLKIIFPPTSSGIIKPPHCFGIEDKK